MTDLDDAEDRKKDLALFLRSACKRSFSLKFDCKSSISLRALAYQLPELHEVNQQMIMLKSGLQLGLMRAA